VAGFRTKNAPEDEEDEENPGWQRSASGWGMEGERESRRTAKKEWDEVNGRRNSETVERKTSSSSSSKRGRDAAFVGPSLSLSDRHRPSADANRKEGKDERERDMSLC
jgi:hypothetical protein